MLSGYPSDGVSDVADAAARCSILHVSLSSFVRDSSFLQLGFFFSLLSCQHIFYGSLFDVDQTLLAPNKYKSAMQPIELQNKHLQTF